MFEDEAANIMRAMVGALAIALPFLLLLGDGVVFDGEPFPRGSLRRAPHHLQGRFRRGLRAGIMGRRRNEEAQS